MNYTFSDHLHNYSVWTAARAVQRGYTTTNNIKSAIDATELQDLSIRGENMSQKVFDNFHRQTANEIIQNIEEKGIKTTYGRAAKIIAVYLKTAIIIRDSGESTLSKIIHPPIDNILLTNLSKSNKELGLSNIKWTQLNEKEYFELIEKLRTLNLNYFWELEEHWTPIQK